MKTEVLETGEGSNIAIASLEEENSKVDFSTLEILARMTDTKIDAREIVCFDVQTIYRLCSIMVTRQVAGVYLKMALDTIDLKREYFEVSGFQSFSYLGQGFGDDKAFFDFRLETVGVVRVFNNLFGRLGSLLWVLQATGCVFVTQSTRAKLVKNCPSAVG